MKTSITGHRLMRGQNAPLGLNSLQALNILFGKNGSGKSSFLRNLYQSDSENFHLVVPERGGDIQYSSAHFDQELDVNARKNARNKNNDNEYRNRVISRATNILNSEGYKSMSGLKESTIKLTDISNLFAVFLPEFKVAFSQESPHRLKIYREHETGEQEVTSASQLSSGQAEALSLAADIITQAVLWGGEEKILLIDEPDAHLHLDLQNRFAIFISEIIKQFGVQIVIATHSPALIASLLSLNEDVAIFCMDTESPQISAVKKDQSVVFSNLLNIDLGLAVILNRKIIIVEGNDDFLVWNQACRAPSFGDAVIIQANGSDIYKYKANAEKILDSILDRHDRTGITILDGDNKGVATNSESSQLPYARLRCYSLENLLLTNEVLNSIDESLDLNAKLEELKGKTADGQEKQVLDELISDKKGTKIDKELIKKVHAAIDKHATSRDWRIILGKFIGKGKPVGEFAEFLGEDVVNYIWANA